jgi:ADP-dependent NAD(P)H-hydrate dehydratase / NAD(P)H-hydrate epimerase
MSLISLELFVPLPSSEEMRALDEATIASGTTSLTLMERAAQGVCDELISWVDPACDASLVILCGCGNNGGDGLAVARLAPGHWHTTVVIASGNASSDFLYQLQRVGESKHGALRIFRLGDSSLSVISGLPEITEHEFSVLHPTPTIVVDALLGTGQQSEPRGRVAEVLAWLAPLRNQSWRLAHWVSIDVPTGVNASTGALYDGAFLADKTVSIECTKRGLTQYPGRSAVGALSLVPIGITADIGTVEYSYADSKTLPWNKPLPTVHKGNRGQVFVIAGSQAMPGAAVLCSLAALHAGSGTVCKLHHESLNATSVPPEVMLVYADMTAGNFSSCNDDSLKDRISQASALAIGPGLGVSEVSVDFLRSIIKQWKDLPRESRPRIVLDADGLTILSQWLVQNTWHELGISAEELVITPHPKEAARLLQVSVEEIQGDRFLAVKKLTDLIGVSVLLKGAGTIVHNGFNGVVIGEGGAELAVGGSGDVLTGCIAALLANGFSPFEAAYRAACMHGSAGERASKKGIRNITASDIARELCWHP